MVLLTFNIVNNKSDFKKGHFLSDEELVNITVQNATSILRLLEFNNILATFFVEISLVEKIKPIIKKMISGGHELALYNQNATLPEIETAKKCGEELTGKMIRGIRQKDLLVSVEDLKRSGFTYISNIENADILFPLKRLKRSTEISLEHGIHLIPESISPYSQIPYNDFVFQVLPLKYYENMVLETIKNDDFVVVYLNTWQFTDVEKHGFDIPIYRRYNSGRKMENKLENFLVWINEENLAYSRMKDFIF